MSNDGPIYTKFIVQRTDHAEDDPTSKHHPANNGGRGCAYFVLDLDHDPFASDALAAYAAACARTHPRLAWELRWLVEAFGRAVEAPQ